MSAVLLRRMAINACEEFVGDIAQREWRLAWFRVEEAVTSEAAAFSIPDDRRHRHEGVEVKASLAVLGTKSLCREFDDLIVRTANKASGGDALGPLRRSIHQIKAPGGCITAINRGHRAACSHGKENVSRQVRHHIKR